MKEKEAKRVNNKCSTLYTCPAYVLGILVENFAMQYSLKYILIIIIKLFTVGINNSFILLI